MAVVLLQRANDWTPEHESLELATRLENGRPQALLALQQGLFVDDGDYELDLHFAYVQFPAALNEALVRNNQWLDVSLLRRIAHGRAHRYVVDNQYAARDRMRRATSSETSSHVTRVRSHNRVRGYQSSIEQSVADADTERRADGYLREQARLQLMNVRIDPAALGQSSSSLLRIAQGITDNGMSDDALALLFGATYAPNPPEQPKAVEEPLKPSEAAPVDWRKRSVRFKR